jgi:hypothetical protein
MTARQARRVSALLRESKALLRTVVACYQGAGVPKPFVRDMIALELYRVDPRLGRQFDCNGLATMLNEDATD